MTRYVSESNPARRRRGAAQIVLVMLVMLVIGLAATGAVRRSIATRRMDQHRDRSLALDRMLGAAQQWYEAGGAVDDSDVTLRLPSGRAGQEMVVVLQRIAGGRLQITATLSREGRSIATRSRLLDTDTHGGRP